jgi:hypothetical protein
MAEITEERITEAVQDGEDAFWAAVVELFPEAKSGDLAPDAAHALSRAMEGAIRAWVDANITSQDAEDLGVRG